VTDPAQALGREAMAHADALYNLARHLTGRDEDAEDLVQDTLARALGAADRFVAGTNLKAWLFRILRNAFLDGARRRRHAPVRDGRDPDEEADTAPIHGALRGDAELERLRTVVGEEIEEALMTLSEEGRTVVLLDLEGLSEAEIADVVRCAPGTVKSRLFRARAALRERLHDYGPGGER
jgi:RNA polymerase sigma-70 factor (ECF subfamily)